ncbi:MAG TPA: hypothetical protein VFK36_10240 [Gemmatimonadales bacterium]|nr:hypothetical protein [Gemmatimonadales bacterium]
MSLIMLFFTACLTAACGAAGRRAGAQIVLDTIVQLQTGPGPGELPLVPLSVAPIPDGGYLAIVDGLVGGSSVQLRKLYDSTGRYIGSLSRLGDGPGEYRQAVAAARFKGDSLYLWDRQRRLMTVLDRSAHPVRTFVVNANGFRLTEAADGHFVLDGYADGGNYSEPLNAFTPAGKLIAAFGEVTPRARFAPGPPVERVVTSDGHGGWWTVRSGYRYEVEHWDSTLHRTAQWLPETNWFPVQHDLESPARGETGFEHLRPGASWIQVDSAGRLWIGGHVPAPGAQEKMDTCIRGGTQPFPCLMQLGERSFETVVEVRSPQDGHLLMSVRGLPALYPMSGGLFYSARTDEDGFVHVSVVRLGREL